MFGLTYLMSMFASKYKEVPANEQFYSPLRIALHSTVNINMIDWFIAIPELNKSMMLPTSDMSVLAIGTTESEGNKVFNFYLKTNANEEFTLQVFCSPNDNGTGMEAREATLYRDVRNVSPPSVEDWTEELQHVGEKNYELAGNVYDRVWNDAYEAKMDMLRFDETVIHGDNVLQYTNNYILYSRKLTTTPQEELLLVGVEETEDTAESVTRIGLTVPLSSIKVQ